MARKLIEMYTYNGDTLLLAVDVPDEAIHQVGNTEIPIEKVDKAFDTVKDLILQGCRPLTEAFHILRQESQAAEAEVEFGINFTAKGNLYLAESSEQGLLKVKVTWRLQPELRNP
jgi:hypothetical protein